MIHVIDQKIVLPESQTAVEEKFYRFFCLISKLITVYVADQMIHCIPEGIKDTLTEIVLAGVSYPMEMARFQDEMAYRPMVGLTAMIPPGGAGTEFHVIPVEKASKSHTFSDDRKMLTEEEVKIEASRCLSCGATYVDQNKCIGCGLCTTKCRFDAIHLVRNHPEFVNYCDADHGVAKILEHGLKRKIKLTVKTMTHQA